jgi:hypothetical protein
MAEILQGVELKLSRILTLSLLFRESIVGLVALYRACTMIREILLFGIVPIGLVNLVSNLSMRTNVVAVAVDFDCAVGIVVVARTSQPPRLPCSLRPAWRHSSKNHHLHHHWCYYCDYHR